MQEPIEQENRRGRKRVLGGNRCNFYPGEKLDAAMDKLDLKRKRMKLPAPFTKSYILREGAWMFVDYINSLMDRARRGDSEAGKVVQCYGQQYKKDERGTGYVRGKRDLKATIREVLYELRDDT